MEGLPAGIEPEEVGETLPEAIERRLVLRALIYWKSIRGERDFPSIADIEPADIPDIWFHCLVLDLTRCPADPVVRTIGRDLLPYAGGSPVDRHISDIPPDTLLGASVAYFNEVLQLGVPVSRGGELCDPDGTRFLYRSIILPMSDDDTTISELIVALNCRGIAEA